MDTAITIRTVVVSEGKAYVQAGAGIVADSDPAKEYEETLNKARALLRAAAMVAGSGAGTKPPGGVPGARHGEGSASAVFRIGQRPDALVKASRANHSLGACRFQPGRAKPTSSAEHFSISSKSTTMGMDPPSPLSTGRRAEGLLQGGGGGLHERPSTLAFQGRPPCSSFTSTVTPWGGHLPQVRFQQLLHPLGRLVLHQAEADLGHGLVGEHGLGALARVAATGGR